MKLPEKEVILNWVNKPTILRLMKENTWTYDFSKQWFTDFMCWMYTSVRSELETDKFFSMDELNNLDKVWHAYILNTKDYFTMSQELFDINYIHHDPENPFLEGEFENEELTSQIMMLIDDWGEEYVDRVWKYGADIHDIINGEI